MWYLGKKRQGKEVRMLRPRTAHARSKKKKSKREIRTTAPRSACERLTDCANRASWFKDGGIIN